ncbi:hypothetical protein GCM10009610_23300 [Pseudonocardia xinjiangensis]
MNVRPVIDAGPALNFFSINRERLLLGTLGPISVPELVRDEVLRKAATDPRFRSAEWVWNKLPDKYLEILSDDETPELNVAVARISGRATTAFRQSSRPICSPPTCSNAIPRGSDGSSRAAVVCGLRTQPMITSVRSRMRSHEPRLAAQPGSAVGPGGQRAT